jgi:signal transduction histidine kinase
MTAVLSRSWRDGRAWLGARPLVGDALLALALLVTQQTFWLVASREAWPATWGEALVLGVLEMVPVVLRRRWPLIAVGITAVYYFVGTLLYPDTQSGGFSLLVIGYTVAAYLSLRRALLANAVLWGPALGASVLVGPPAATTNVPQWYFLGLNLAVALVAFFVGRTVHNRRAYTVALEERARAAEENQRALADQAVADERRRIARELHDVVAHHVSVMGVLATGARRVLSRDPAAADEALGTIEETGRTALREMRRLLTVLRTDAEPAADLTPQPGLAGIEALVEQVRDAGLPVTLAVGGPATEPLDPGVALTIFRIVQEALTNTLKHAGEATAEVRLDVGQRWLHLEVFDTGQGPRLDRTRLGHGLLGMRERVALYGGTLRVGPRPGGGFRVYAKIPMDQLDRSSTS